jgi:ubiquinone/menaquinone biosynthesis C-methylase UbiE
MNLVLLQIAEQQTLVIVGIGIAALVIVVLAAMLLARLVVRRRPKAGGPPPPVEAPELYDLRTADVNDDIRFCVEMARSVGGPVLELGAGTGRVTLPLARTGLVVTGLETSRLMLQRAKMKADQMSSKLHVEWVEGDITNFSLGGRTFRLILAPFHVLQELRDLNEMEKCLRCVADHLEPTGKFVVMMQPPRWDTLKVERRFLKSVHNPRTNEIVNVYQSLDVDPIWQKLRGEYEYEVWEHDGKVRQMVAPFEGSYVTCPEMALLLRAAGMQMEAVYGSFERDKLTAQSKEMIFVARPLQAAKPAAALPAPATSGKAAAAVKAPVLAAASASAAIPAPASSSAPAAKPVTSPATVVLPETAPTTTAKTAPAGGKAGGAETITLPAVSNADASSSTAGKSGAAPAQSVQSPPAPSTGRHSTSQRRHSKPSR